VQTVDRPYPGSRQLRHNDLGAIDPAGHIDSLHNLYLDLYAGRWVESEDLRHGLLTLDIARELKDIVETYQISGESWRRGCCGSRGSSTTPTTYNFFFLFTITAATRSKTRTRPADCSCAREQISTPRTQTRAKSCHRRHQKARTANSHI
jgi:hypothetical protein